MHAKQPYLHSHIHAKFKLAHARYDRTCYSLTRTVIVYLLYLQVMEDRGGELRKAKERYRWVSIAAMSVPCGLDAWKEGGPGGGGVARGAVSVVHTFSLGLDASKPVSRLVSSFYE